LQTEKERIDFAKNHSLYMNLHIAAYINELTSNYRTATYLWRAT